MDTERIYRAIDANTNRAVEGLRVAEDGIRFVLDDPGLTQALTQASRQSVTRTLIRTKCAIR